MRKTARDRTTQTEDRERAETRADKSAGSAAEGRRRPESERLRQGDETAERAERREEKRRPIEDKGERAPERTSRSDES